MRIIVATAVFAAVFQLGESLSTAYQTVVPATQQALWGDFKVTFGKNYSSSEEEANRFNVFVANLALIDAKNEAETGTAVHGITKFADRTPEEFHAYLTFVPKPDHGFDVDNVTQPLLAGATVNVDWTGKYTTPIKNQGYCGSCWAFSGVEQMESDYMRKFGKLYKLSTQQATSCAYPQGTGCSGGWPEDAINSANNGFEQEKDYPYISGSNAPYKAGSCKYNPSEAVMRTSGFTMVSTSASGESTMASYVGGTGPLSVCVNADSWASYTGGILSTCVATGGHCAQIVGLNTAASKPYWKVRNSWGKDWGESGFIRLSYGHNTCQIASHALHSKPEKLGGAYCSNGIKSNNICCAQSCGQCGGSGCGGAPGGSSNCCTNNIQSAGRYCANSADVACIIPG